ncbi:MAG: hypothetical protein ACJ8G2_06025, partial [Burkholderiales bacterium]
METLDAFCRIHTAVVVALGQLVLMKQMALTLTPAPAPALNNFYPGRNVELLTLLGNLVAGRDVERSIYLWGDPGSGRSHLLQATIDALNAAGLACMYVAS